MANRRMISLKVVDTDLFLDMPITSRLLYYDLNIRADDDGFVASPKKIQRMIGCSDDDMKMLIAKKFIIPFENGICVIRHWRVHNYIQKDRYTPTMYKYEKNMLESENGVYYISEQHMDTKCIQDGSNMDTQVRLGKDRLVLNKDNIVQSKDKNEIKEQIEKLWKLYPFKKGKATAVKKIANILKVYSFDEIKLCIERYIQYVEDRRKTDFKELKYQNGSTFFNGTYEDYLDKNYITVKTTDEKQGEFFGCRTWDPSELSL